MQFRYILFFVFFCSFFTFSQEWLLKTGKDSLVVTANPMDETDKTLELIGFSSSKQLFSQSPYFRLLFNDEDRRIINKSAYIDVLFQEDSIRLNGFSDILFKNPGKENEINIQLKVYAANGELLELNSNPKGKVRYTFLAEAPKTPIISDDKIIFGLLGLILAFVFYTSHLQNRVWKRFYTIIPALFLCYMIPAGLTSVNLIDPETSGLYYMASRYLLPRSLILLILSADIKGLFNLGSKSLIMFFTGTVGIILGGVFVMWFFGMINPEIVGGEGDAASWRGFATIAGSWIGGGANQSAMLETYKYKESLFGGMLLVDIVVANIWMAVILFGIGKTAKIDKWLKADSSAIDELVVKVENFQKSVERKATLTDFMVILGLVFAGVGLSHFLGDVLAGVFESMWGNTSTFASSFFWMVVLSTIYGLILSFTRAKNYEGVGASKIGSVFLYILVATIGMKVDISKVFDKPALILVGLVWMAFHAGLLILMAKLIRAPFFFLAVGSQANVGGAASAPIVANAFHPALTTVGVIMAVFGYFIGTFGAIICAELMALLAP